MGKRDGKGGEYEVRGNMKHEKRVGRLVGRGVRRGGRGEKDGKMGKRLKEGYRRSEKYKWKEGLERKKVDKGWKKQGTREGLELHGRTSVNDGNKRMKKCEEKNK